MKRTEQQFSQKCEDDSIKLLVDTKTRYQTILGFGGAVTDAVTEVSTYNLVLPLVNQYFGETSIGYTLVRAPIASCDFSLSEYSYAEVDQDFYLSKISFFHDERKIELLKKIIDEASKSVRGAPKFFASPWSGIFYFRVV